MTTALNRKEVVLGKRNSMTLNDSWDEARERVRAAADIVQVIGEHVRLRRAGTNFTGLCPFHGEKTPSFIVNPQRQSYKCFGCGESGDVFSFLMKYQHLSYPDSLKELARRHQISLPEPKLNAVEQEQRQRRELLATVNQAAAQLYHDCLCTAPQAEAARQYLAQRGVPQDFISTYQLGYAPAAWDFISSRLAARFSLEVVEQAGLAVRKNSGTGSYDRFRDRVMFPISDHSGRICAFGGRLLNDGQPKYMNSPESPIFEKGQILFGLYQHREVIRQSRVAVLVEGNFDLLLLDVHGINNTVAPLGTALTKEHVRSLRRVCNEVVLLFDGDTAGLRAARRAVPIFLSERLEAKAALLPAGYDPDSFVREHGAAAVKQLLDAAAPLPEFIFDALVQEHGLTLSGKSKIMAELNELVQLSPDKMQRELMAAHFADKLGIRRAGRMPSPPLEEQGMEPPLPETVPEEGYPEPVLEKAAPLAAHEQQLLRFLVFYPEHFQALAKGGLLEYLPFCAPPVREAVSAMQQLAGGGSFAPEQLLTVLAESQVRRLVAGLLQQGSDTETLGDEEQSQALCLEMLAWLRREKGKQERAALQRQLVQAEQQGKKELVEQLQAEIYKLRSGK